MKKSLQATDSNPNPVVVFFCFLFFFCFSFLFFFFLIISKKVHFLSVTTFVQCENMKLNFLVSWIQEQYKSEHRVQEVCCSMCFIVSLVSLMFILKKKSEKAKEFKLKFCGIKHAFEKQMCLAALRLFCLFVSELFILSMP